jgi:hypothetical protein
MGKITSQIMSKDMIDSKNKAMVDLGSLSNRVGVVETSLTEKAKQSDLDATNGNVALKSNKTYVDSQDLLKANQTQVDQLQGQINTFQNTNDLATGKDPETISTRTNSTGQTFETVSNRVNFSEMGSLFNWDNSPFAYNVKKFEYPSPLEQGYINFSNGALQTNTANVRTQNYFTVSNTLTVINKNPTLYNYRIFDYDTTTSAFISYQGWITSSTSTISVNTNKRKLCFQRTDGGTTLTVNEIMNNFIIYDAKKPIRNPIEAVVVGFGKYSYPEISGNGENIVITITNSLFALDYTGKQVQLITTYTTSNPGIFTLVSNQVLVWNLDSNQIVVIGNNTVRDTNHVVLLSNYKGYAQNGFWVKYYRKEDQYLPINEHDYEVIPNAWVWGQDASMVGNEIWAFMSSNDDHSNVANVYGYDKTTFNTYNKFTHNLGHVASQDYNKNSDSFMLSNGSGDATVLPRLDIIQNASTYPNNTYFQYGTSSVLSIPFFTGSKQIGGNGAVSCWGAGKNIVWMFVDATTEMKLYKIMLGMGTNDLSDKSPGGTDTSKWGTFIGGLSTTQYNGTALILGTYTMTGDKLPTMQGAAYKDGYIYLSASNSRIHIFKIQPNDHNKYRVVDNININQYKSDGTIQTLEMEGVVFLDDGSILATVFGDGSLLGNTVIKIK